MSAPIDAATLRACCVLLCEDCAEEPPADCMRDSDENGVWWHQESEHECDASTLREALDRTGTLLGARVFSYACPTCGGQYTEIQPVPCCEECHPERFS